jgi:hypothetical protein
LAENIHNLGSHKIASFFSQSQSCISPKDSAGLERTKENEVPKEAKGWKKSGDIF